MNMFTIVAITSPMSAINNSLPTDVRSVLVVYPINAITANVAAVIKNTLAIDSAV